MCMSKSSSTELQFQAADDLYCISLMNDLSISEEQMF